MEALKTKGVAHKGVLSVSVPKEFEERELEVIILSTHEQSKETTDNERDKQEEKVKRLMSIIGAAKFPEFPLTKYDVYDQ